MYNKCFGATPLPKGTTVAMNDDSVNPDHIWAVVVGISKYKNIAGLNYADKDALAFYDYLKNKGVNESHVQLFTNEKALATDIYAGLEWLGDNVKANDRVIFYFSGHGDVETKTIYQNGFLLATDAPSAAYMTKGTISIIYLQQYLETYIAKNKAKDVLLIVDACRSGKLAGGTEGIQITMHALGQTWNNQIIKILSAQEGEASFEDKKWGGGRGVFSYYLVKGLEGLANKNADSVITTAELASYLPSVVGDATGSVQNPTITGNVRQNLFSFNSTLMAMAHHDDQSTTIAGPVLAARGGAMDDLDPEIKTWYDKYRDYLQKGRLLWGEKETDTLNCAKHYYIKLTHDVRAKALQSSLRSSFVASLQRKTEDNLDKYIKADAYGFANAKEACQELIYAQSLVDTSYILYNYLTARILFAKAEAMDTRKEAPEAIRLLKSILKIEPDAAYAYNAIGFIYDHKVGIGDSAIYYYEKALTLSPTWSSSYNEIGFYYSINGNYEKASHYHQLSINVDPLFASEYISLANDYRHMHRNEIADSLINRGVLIINEKMNSKTSIPWDYIELADLLNAKKDYNRAIISLTKFVDLNKKEYYGYEVLGRTYLKSENYPKAIENLKVSLNLKPNDDQACWLLGIAYDKLKKYQMAITYYIKSIHFQPANYDVYDYLAHDYVKINKFSEALKVCDSGIKIDPNYGGLYYNKARILALENKKNESLKYFAIALEKGFRNFDTVNNDKDLVSIKTTPEFTALMKKYFPDKHE